MIVIVIWVWLSVKMIYLKSCGGLWGVGGGYAFRFRSCHCGRRRGRRKKRRRRRCWSQASFCPALPQMTSRRQQWAAAADRRLPLSDYNLWSISIIGGVCRDSYSNNYLDQTVSKATAPPPTTQHTNSVHWCLPGHWEGIVDSIKNRRV